MKTHSEYYLEMSGFELAGPDIWAKIAGEATAFIEATPDGMSAWLWHAEKETYLGPKIDIRGTHDAAVEEAVRQLQMLLAEESETGALNKSMTRNVEHMTALDAS